LKTLSILLAVSLMLTFTLRTTAGAATGNLSAAAQFVVDRGIFLGDQYGNYNFPPTLNAAT
jgi:hypothetical protein